MRKKCCWHDFSPWAHLGPIFWESPALNRLAPALSLQPKHFNWTYLATSAMPGLKSESGFLIRLEFINKKKNSPRLSFSIFPKKTLRDCGQFQHYGFPGKRSNIQQQWAAVWLVRSLNATSAFHFGLSQCQQLGELKLLWFVSLCRCHLSVWTRTLLVKPGKLIPTNIPGRRF